MRENGNKTNYELFFSILFIEPAPFPFKIGWGLTPSAQSTSSPSSFMHQSQTSTTSGSENATTVLSSPSQRNTTTASTESATRDHSHDSCKLF